MNTKKPSKMKKIIEKVCKDIIKQDIAKPNEFDLFIRITNSCNLQCNHCCYSCGPGEKTMTEPEIEQILEKNIEHKIRRIMFSGGEVFTAKKTLMHALGYLKKNKKHMPMNPKILVSTNGTWAKDKRAFYRTLNELRNYGVDEVDISSRDEYHEEQGIDTKKLENLISTIGEFSKLPNVSFRGCAERVMPFGRAKNLPKKTYMDRQCNIFPNSNLADVTIDPYGNVYPCCWEVTKPMGSALKKSFKKIFEQARQDSLISILMKEGPGSVGRYLGIVEPKDYHSYSCVLCEKIFRNLKT